MRRSQLTKLYATTYRIDPATGKERPVSRYIGKYYWVDAAQKRRIVRHVWILWGAALAAFVTSGVVPARAGQFVGVSLWYMCCLLPLFYLLMAAIHLTRMGEKITEVDKAEGIAAARQSGWALAVLGMLWSATDAVLLLARGLPDNWWADVLFLVCGTAVTAAGILTARCIGRMKVREVA